MYRLRLPPNFVFCLVATIEKRQRTQVWYVLGSKWWQLWKAYVRFDEQTPPAAAAATAPSPAAVATSRSPSNSSSMEEDGVLVKAEEDGLVVVAAEGGGESVTVKAENNEHRVAELSLDEGGGDGVSVTMKADQELAQRAGPGPINNQSLGEGRELREGMVSYFTFCRRACTCPGYMGLAGYLKRLKRPCFFAVVDRVRSGGSPTRAFTSHARLSDARLVHTALLSLETHVLPFFLRRDPCAVFFFCNFVRFGIACVQH